MNSTVVYESTTSLRHYYKITDKTAFDVIKRNITFAGMHVRPVDSGELVYFELQNIAANQLDTQYVLKIGESEYRYSVMIYVKRLLDSGSDEKFIELGKATYRFNEAANTYLKCDQQILYLKVF